MLARAAVFFLLPACLGAPTKGEEEELDEGYGETWMYFPDGEGVPQKINLTEPAQGRASQEDKVHFQLYTRRNKDVYSELVVPEDNQDNEIPNAFPFGDEHFQPKREIKIVTHGWTSSGQSDSVQTIKNAYLTNRDCNVIIVDWEELASNLFYLIPAYNTKIAGRKTGKLIDYLVEDFGIPLTQFHMIGHSLGAHVSGYAGSSVSKGKIARVTGLDPAKPGFEKFNVVEDRLDESDARFVDVIHTCAGVLGFSEPLGTADFYPNGGKSPQPGCEGFFPMAEGCSHGRSYMYFAESINNPFGFPSRLCPDERDISEESCGGRATRQVEEFMGDACKMDVQGVYYTTTSDQEPYGNT